MKIREMSMFKKIFKKIYRRKQLTEITTEQKSRYELEKKVVEGAEKALREYRGVFERIAEFDRTK